MKDSRKAKYEKALKHLKAAQDLLTQIGRENQKDYNSDRYACMIQEVISCDNGEAGLESFIKNHVK